jgi:flagellar motor switch protein FliN/FliY
MIAFLDCWQQGAVALFAQALAGEPALVDALPKPMPGGAFGWAYELDGELQGRLAVLLDAAVLERPLLGEGVDQKDAWSDLLREVADAACGDLLARAGQTVRVAAVEETAGLPSMTRAFQLQCGDDAFAVVVRDDTRQGTERQATGNRQQAANSAQSGIVGEVRSEERGRELLLDVELDTTLRFGCRELPLSELLELGPGDVVPLDRQVSDPVDLVVGDKILARGEVVLVNGNFGLRVVEVAEPRKRLETIRCLF